MQELHQKYPLLLSATISYEGSGDDFGSFWESDFKYSEVTPRNTYDEVSFINDADTLLWHAIENSDADFNNDGSDGTITLDFTNYTMTIDNYWKEIVSNASGEITFGEDDEEEQDEWIGEKDEE